MVKLLKWPDSRLTQYCDPVTTFDKQLRDEVAMMEYVLSFSKEGLALAGPQIGIMKRIITIKPNKFKLQGPVINPEIIDHSEEWLSEIEGCLSFPGMFASVSRPKWLQLKYLDIDGVEQEYRASGLCARMICHEIDHLNGILFTTYVKDKVRSTIENKMLKKKRRKRR
jgi:peptide deformylase